MSFMLNIDFNHLLDSSKELSLVFMALFFGILFLQSGLDKVFNFNDNLNFLKNHFQKTLFKSQVNLLFITLIILEIVTGMIFIVSLFGVCLYGFSELLTALLFLGVIMSNITLCFLFLGQRIAHDYVGAANLTIYFLVALLSFFLFF